MGIRRYHVEKDAVATDSIQDGAVTNAKLAANAVKSININKAFSSEITQSVSGGGTWTITAGIYLVVLGTHTSVEYTPDAGSHWRTLIAAGGSGVVISDGASVRLKNAGGSAEDSYLLPLA